MDGGEEIIAQPVCLDLYVESNSIYYGFFLILKGFEELFSKYIFKLGPNTKNYEWADWEEWSECSVACGGDGTKTRTRACIPPSNGGFDCPESSQTETESCNNGPCPSNAWIFVIVKSISDSI